MHCLKRASRGSTSDFVASSAQRSMATTQDLVMSAFTRTDSAGGGPRIMCEGRSSSINRFIRFRSLSLVDFNRKSFDVA
eukprot:4395296-Alexandrium_andersonii.AAC.1